MDYFLQSKNAIVTEQLLESLVFPTTGLFTTQSYLVIAVGGASGSEWNSLPFSKQIVA